MSTSGVRAFLGLRPAGADAGRGARVTGPNDRYGVLARGIRRDLSEKGWVPVRYWVLWWTALGAAMVLFYVVLTPVWLGLRAAAWVAELRSRARGRRRGAA